MHPAAVAELSAQAVSARHLAQHPGAEPSAAAHHRNLSVDHQSGKPCVGEMGAGETDRIGPDEQAPRRGDIDQRDPFEHVELQTGLGFVTTELGGNLQAQQACAAQRIDARIRQATKLVAKRDVGGEDGRDRVDAREQVVAKLPHRWMVPPATRRTDRAPKRLSSDAAIRGSWGVR